MQIKAVLFDMFDTLVLINKNYEFYTPAIARMHKYLATQRVNVPFEQFRGAYIKARDELYAKAEKNLEEPHFNMRIADALQLLGFNFDISNPVVSGATLEFCQEFIKSVCVDEHAEAVLQGLHGKYRLGIVSNFAIPECVYSLLKTYGLNGMFDAVVVSAAVNKRKPRPEIFQTALKLMGFSAGEAVFVGDTADADVAGAKKVGMKAVYLKRRVEEGFEKTEPDVVIESLADLPSAIESL